MKLAVGGYFFLDQIVVKWVGQRGINLYLKRLEILGFKSFADKIKLEFMPGVTAVVGPNGSGKSNISDALRWVLGEQSIKNLRGSKMDDVIFAGTELRKPLGLAEVTMILDNFDHALPLDFDEISITRKLFRSGESEYLINKSPVRLKDIHDLFYDTGLGKDAYSVIGQGKIDGILSVKAEERRNIFEEAAGINRYKTRKQIAERKLEDTDRNLVRIQDIITELQARLEPLKNQAVLAEKYLALKEKLTGVEINYYGGLIRQSNNELDELNRSRTELMEKRREFENQESVIDAEIETNRLGLLEQDERLNTINEEYFRIQNLIDKYGEQVNSSHNKLEDIKNQAGEYRNAIANNLSKKEAFALEEAGLDQEMAMIGERLARETAVLQAEEQALAAAGATLGSEEAREETLKNELIETLNETAALKNRLSSATLQKEFIIKQTADFGKKSEQLTKQALDLDQAAQSKETELTVAEEKIAALRQALTAQSGLLTSAEDELTALEEKNQEWRRLIGSLESKINLLEEMEKGFHGYFQGVKALLAEAANESFHRKIRGVVADLIRVKPGLELALETALGSALQNIVIEDDLSAEAAIAYLKQGSRGRASFLPLNLIRAVEPKTRQFQELLSQYDCRTAVSILEFDPEYLPVINYLLNQVVIAPNLKTAIRLSSKLERGCRVVTPEGDLVNPGGSITGGSSEKQRLGILSRKREIEDLKREKTESEVFLEKGLRTIKDKKEAFQHNRVELEVLKEQEKEAALKKYSLDQEIQNIRRDRRRHADELRALTGQLEDFQRESAVYDTDQAEIKLEIERKGLTLKNIETNLKNLSISLETAKSRKDGQLRKIGELKSQLSAGRQELNGKQLLKDNLLKQLAEVERDSRVIDAKLEELTAEQAKTGAALAELDREISAANLKLQSQQELIGSRKIAKEEILAKIKELEIKGRSCRRKNAELQNQLYHLELSLNQKAGAIENTRRNLDEDYGAGWEERVDSGWVEPEAVHAVIAELKESLRELGAVNLAAIDDYCRLNQRYAFLTAQADDLHKAKASLQQVIVEIEKTIVKRFRETFAQIRSEFTKIFAELFEGGNADLFLVNPDEILSSGIEVIAQPPGKKLQVLSLLSGGERAMTAIALLFAILAIKPAPFCILDEIDATLDEVNVRRFSRLLEIFSEKLQFVVVTHRRGTMEVANALYGVTMEEMGISKLISLNLNEKVG